MFNLFRKLREQLFQEEEKTWSEVDGDAGLTVRHDTYDPNPVGVAREWDPRFDLPFNVDTVHECPTCRQYVAIYKRRISLTAAMGLYNLYRKYGRKQVKLKSFSIRNLGGKTGIYTLSLWKLIEPTEVPGYYRVTILGEGFLTQNYPLPAYLEVYNGKVIGESEEEQEVTFESIISKKLNYKDLVTALENKHE